MNQEAYEWPGAYTIENGQKVPVSASDFGKNLHVYLPEEEYDRFVEHLSEADFQEWKTTFEKRYQKASPHTTLDAFAAREKAKLLDRINADYGKPVYYFEVSAQRAYKALTEGYDPHTWATDFGDAPAICTQTRGHYAALSWAKQLRYLDTLLEPPQNSIPAKGETPASSGLENYLTDAGKPIMPFILTNYKAAKTKSVAALLYAMHDLGMCGKPPNLNQAKLFRDLEEDLGVTFKRQSLNKAISTFNQTGKERLVDAAKTGIRNYLATLETR